jgi:hypothetical protein
MVRMKIGGLKYSLLAMGTSAICGVKPVRRPLSTFLPVSSERFKSHSSNSLDCEDDYAERSQEANIETTQVE